MPDHVAIIGLGPSCEQYLYFAKNLGGRHEAADEIWAINGLGGVLAYDRLFHMDDVRIQEIRAAARPDSNIAAMLKWMRGHPGPIYTSFTHPDYPGLVAFPLEAVVNDIGFAYLNNTAAYAVAYAIHIKVKKISLFGCDFTYPNSGQAERGRGCVEFLLGIAAARGIEIRIAGTSSLLDTCFPDAERLYGYDCVDIEFGHDGGLWTAAFTPKAALPTADEIEALYDHSNPVLRKEK